MPDGGGRGGDVTEEIGGVKPEDSIDPWLPGLVWNNIGETMPSQANPLDCDSLSVALQTKTTFTEDKWKDFGIDHLSMYDVIKSGKSYFRPAAFLAAGKNGIVSSSAFYAVILLLRHICNHVCICAQVQRSCEHQLRMCTS